MNIPNMEKANILIEALPYIQKYYGKTVVVKYGGNAMTDENLKQAVMNDVVLLSLIGIRIVLVHGGGPEITGTLKQMDIESKFIDGLRQTDKKTMEVVQMVLAGKTNKDLVNLIQRSHGNAIGLCGIDGSMIQAEKKDHPSGDLGYVGEITKINTKPIVDMLDNGYLPIIATVGEDTDGNVYNINADTAASHIAGALSAETLILMTDIRGLLRDKNDDSTLIPEVHVSDVPSLVAQKIIDGGMIPKVESCVTAVRQGVKKSVIIDGRIPHSILIEIMTDEGIGTMFH